MKQEGNYFFHSRTEDLKFFFSIRDRKMTWESLCRTLVKKKENKNFKESIKEERNTIPLNLFLL